MSGSYLVSPDLATHSADMTDLSSRVTAVLDTAIEEQRVVGAIALVMRDGDMTYHRAVGLADREAGRRMTESTPHRLASLTKPVVAVATLALVNRGVLTVDDPVTRWLPSFRPRYGDDTPAITIHHLLTHTSGLGYGFLEPVDGPYHRAHISDGLDQPGLSIAENLERLASVPLRARPGSAFNYSLSFDVLGAIIERATGRSLADAVAELVTTPLDLHDIVFTPRSPLEAASVAVPYSDGSPPSLIRTGHPVAFPPFEVSFAPERALDPASYPSGGAGLLGTASDFVRFIDALRRRAIPTVSPRLLDDMLRDHLAPLTSDMLGPGVGQGYGASIVIDPAAAGSTLSPGAIRWGGAYGHSWFIDPASRTSAVLLTNTAFEGMTGALRDDLQRAVCP